MNPRHFYPLSLLTAFTLLVAMWTIPMVTAQELIPHSATSFSWSPDGTELAVFADNGVFIYDRSWHLRRYRQQDRFFAYGDWSPDGTKLLIGKYILDKDTLETVLEYKEPFHTWLNNGSQIITFGSDWKEILIRDANNGSLIKTIKSPVQIEYAVPSPDSSHILVVVANGIFVFDVNRAELVGEYIIPSSFIHTYTWSPDGTQIAYSITTNTDPETSGSILSPNLDNPNAAYLSTINIMDAGSGKSLLISSPLPEVIISLAWNRSGDMLAGEAWSGSEYIWNTDTLSLLNSFSVSGQVTGRIAFSPYGGVLAIGISPQTTPDQGSLLPAARPISSLVDNSLQMIVPVTSLENLAAIQNSCSNNAAISLELPKTTDTLNNYISQMETTSDAQLPPGCKADLLAVAEALEAQES